MADNKDKSDEFDDTPEGREARLRLGDTLKKLVTAGIGAAFMTEESIRAYVGELKLPKDVLNAILASASKSKDEIIGRVSNEVIKIVNRIDFVKEASRFVEEHKFRINAEIEVVKKDSRKEN
jgi:hypothetical protein